MNPAAPVTPTLFTTPLLRFMTIEDATAGRLGAERRNTYEVPLDPRGEHTIE